jgi:hypothetical protein
MSPRRSRGQSLAEFALVTPIIVMLIVVVADFGRVFAATLSIEAAARDAAETMANNYLSNPPGPLNLPAPAGVSTYYQPLHLIAAKTVCTETRDLANSAYNQGTGTCPGMPLIQACLHDGQDTECLTEAQSATIPAECTGMTTPPSHDNGGTGSPRWAEVRVCYRFTPILQLPLLSFGEFWLQRTRTFVVPCYFQLGADECG